MGKTKELYTELRAIQIEQVQGGKIPLHLLGKPKTKMNNKLITTAEIERLIKILAKAKKVLSEYSENHMVENKVPQNVIDAQIDREISNVIPLLETLPNALSMPNDRPIDIPEYITVKRTTWEDVLQELNKERTAHD